MDKIRILIGDDDFGMLLIMRKLIERAEGYELVGEARNGEELIAYFDKFHPDVVLMDVEMPGISGVELAKEIRKTNETVQIVFVTGYSDYIAEGYEVSALHYLMKPVNEEKFFSVLDRAVVRLKSREKSVLLECAGETVRVPLHEIRYMDVRQNYVTVHGKEEYTVKKTLGAMERELDSRFFRAGRSLILNLTYIRRVSKTDVYLEDGSILPLPRGVYDSLNRAIIERL
ncbi:MAG: response regulator transcription factor [Clostridia bacterium]|nr:response regulator transcription factor [Clostridia bacterium]